MPGKPVRYRLGDGHESRVHQEIQGGQGISDRFQNSLHCQFSWQIQPPESAMVSFASATRGVSFDGTARSAKLEFRLQGLPLADGCERIALLALCGPHAISDLGPECALKRTSTDHSEFMGSGSNLAPSKALA